MSGQQVVQITNQFGLGGISFNASVSLSADTVTSCTPSVPAAQPSTLTTRTDNNTGVLTMTNSGHGITTGALVDLYWSGGVRRHMTVGTVSGTTVPIDLGSGDNLPLATVAINACVPVKREFAFTNANLALIAVQAFVEAQFTFLESDDSTEDWTQHVTPAVTGAAALGIWYSAYGAIPLTGTAVFWLYMSHGSTTAAAILQAAALHN